MSSPIAVPNEAFSGGTGSGSGRFVDAVKGVLDGQLGAGEAKAWVDPREDETLASKKTKAATIYSVIMDVLLPIVDALSDLAAAVAAVELSDQDRVRLGRCSSPHTERAAVALLIIAALASVVSLAWLGLLLYRRWGVLGSPWFRLTLALQQLADDADNLQLMRSDGRFTSVHAHQLFVFVCEDCVQLVASILLLFVLPNLPTNATLVAFAFSLLSLGKVLFGYSSVALFRVLCGEALESRRSLLVGRYCCCCVPTVSVPVLVLGIALLLESGKRVPLGWHVNAVSIVALVRSGHHGAFSNADRTVRALHLFGARTSAETLPIFVSAADVADSSFRQTIVWRDVPLAKTARRSRSAQGPTSELVRLFAADAPESSIVIHKEAFDVQSQLDMGHFALVAAPQPNQWQLFRRCANGTVIALFQPRDGVETLLDSDIDCVDQFTGSRTDVCGAAVEFGRGAAVGFLGFTPRDIDNACCAEDLIDFAVPWCGVLASGLLECDPEQVDVSFPKRHRDGFVGLELLSLRAQFSFERPVFECGLLVEQ
jgi:hypothetical protein